ncbi:hypothetical protein Tco_1161722, partial [Tanacetum coccineum]
MSRIQAWDDVVDRVSSRLSKWKMKMLSIGEDLPCLNRVIKALYGETGSVDGNVNSAQLGNGEKARFWEDRWFDGVPLKTCFPRLYALELCKDITVASKFLWGIGGLGISSSGEFSVSSVRRLIDDKILPDDVQKT